MIAWIKNGISKLAFCLGQCRHIAEMILGGIWIDVLFQGLLKTFVLYEYFFPRRSGLKIHGHTWLFVSNSFFIYSGTAKIKKISTRYQIRNGLHMELWGGRSCAVLREIAEELMLS